MTRHRVPRIAGHRGAATLEPENTASSFARAARDGADLIELDVHLSADGQVVVHHDATVDRTAVGGRTTGAIAELTWAQLQEVQLAAGQRIPSLGEALDLIEVPVLLELKAVAAARPALDLVQERGITGRVSFISFDAQALRIILDVCPAARRGLLAVEPTAEAVSLADELGCETFSFAVEHAARDVVAAQQARGREVGLWTLHTFDDLRRALAAGADTITADDPAWARSVVDRLLSGV